MIAYGKGGSLETVRDATQVSQGTGLFFSEQTPASIRAAVERFEALPQPISAQDCRAHALQFSEERFRQQFKDRVDQAIQQFSY